MVIGAGGVSPSVILSLQKSGVKNLINKWDSRKVFFFKKKFSNLKILEWKNIQDEIKNYDIIVNATSLGLKNGQDFDFNFENTRENLIYIDTIYNPIETK